MKLPQLKNKQKSRDMAGLFMKSAIYQIMAQSVVVLTLE